MTDTTRRCPDVPHAAWYAAGTSEEVDRTPLSRSPATPWRWRTAAPTVRSR
jgi:hypothetical protein